MAERESPAEARAWTLVNEHALALQRLNDAPHRDAWRAAMAQVRRAEEALVAAIVGGRRFLVEDAIAAHDRAMNAAVRAHMQLRGRRPEELAGAEIGEHRTLGLAYRTAERELRGLLCGLPEPPEATVPPVDASQEDAW